LKHDIGGILLTEICFIETWWSIY